MNTGPADVTLPAPDAASAEVATSAEHDAKALRRRGLTLALLTSAYFFSYMDRQILSILQEHIKADLHLTDTQLGLLAGFAFAVFYATLGIPVARLADRYNRTNIIVIALSIWSAMTALTGLAQNYSQMLIARIGVGVGEAGSSPPSHSMISDLYPPAKRAGAMSIFSLGIALGGGLGTMIGGAVAAAYGWRVAMFTVGLPGLVLAVIIKLLVVEPRRGMSDPVQVKPSTEPMPTLRDGFASIVSSRVTVHLLVAISFATLVGYGNGAFVPSYLQRSHGMSMFSIAVYFAPVHALLGAISAVLGGWIANKVAARWGIWAQCYLIVILKAVDLLPNILAYLAPTPGWALTGFLLDVFLTSSYLGTTFALIQGLAPLRMRALWASITLLVMSLLGAGLGPTMVGAMSEYLQPTFGKESLRYAMVAMQILVPLQVFHFWRAGVALKQTEFGRSRV